ncbi:MAG TPA: redox-regulated ATPase YchF [Candidatus Polarisedimenticolia bacterium]|nr:redox-regulated ATPase YchF [Candidatus Polarisedimenticolia bacterium]
MVREFSTAGSGGPPRRAFCYDARSMRIGLFGFPQAGKTTLFNLLTGGHAETRSFGSGRADPNVGVARVPDARLAALSALFKPRKTVPATFEYVDIVGLQKGDARGSLSLAVLKPMDALAHVVRAFPDDSIPHSEGSLDPARDVETMEMELILADLDAAGKRIERLRTSIPKTSRPEEKRELAALERVVQELEAGRPLRGVPFPPEDEKLLKGFAFYSAKPLLVVVNVGEEDVPRVRQVVERFDLRQAASRPQVAVAAASARIEEEVAALAEEEAAAFRAELGIEEPALERILRVSYSLLGLISFYTVGDDECRAWPIRRGSTAARAAGTIHTDLEKGFIRAEVVRYEELTACGSLAAAKERGQLRLEGKDYVVADGDILHVRSGL